MNIGGITLVLLGMTGAVVASPAVSPPPTAIELLDKYGSALDHFRSVIIKAEWTETYTNQLYDLRGRGISGRPGTKHGRVDLRTDGRRYAHQYQSWGEVTVIYEVVPED